MTVFHIFDVIWPGSRFSAASCTFAIVLMLTAGTASAECDGASCLPDNDETNFNNDFSSAEDLQILGTPLDGGGYKSASEKGHLGLVNKKFDSADFYKFRLPPGTHKVFIRIAETPLTSQWLVVYADDSQHTQLAYEKGGDNDQTTLTLSEGVYYVAVRTDDTVTKPRARSYVLDIAPTLIPIPDTASYGCNQYPNGGEMLPNQRFKGSIDAAKSTDSYNFYISTSQAFFAQRLTYDWRYEVRLVHQQEPWKTFLLVGLDSNSSSFFLFDPGFYCVVISAPVTAAQNYELQLDAGGRSGPSTTKDGAGGIGLTDVGVLSHNGEYKNGRYVNLDPSGGVNLDKPMVLREWVGASKQYNWYLIDIASEAHIRLKATHALEALDIRIVRADNTVEGIGVSEGSSFTHELPPYVLDIPKVSAGRHYLVVRYAGSGSAGTPYRIDFIAATPEQ